MRGSSLLLTGRLISTSINFLAQVLVVRYLSTRDYGAFAYALAGVAFFEGISSLGLRRGISRFAPIYQERRDYDKLFGSIALVSLTIVAVCTLIIGSLYRVPWVGHRLVQDNGLAVPLLLILIFLVPLDAFDDVLISLFASFTKPRAIFFRKNVLAPVLKLAAVCIPMLFHARVQTVAFGHLIASVLGLAVSAVVLSRMLRQQGLLEHFHLRTIRMPAREIFAFAIPLMTSDLVNTAIQSASTVFLGYYHDTTQVAFYRVVMPMARLNLIVMTTFQLLYMPHAARLFGRNDAAAVNTLYWRTAVWMAVLSFPIFALTFSLAHTVTLAVYGSRYEQSWVILQILAFASYFNLATGFNGITLMVLGKLRYTMVVNAVAVALSLLLDFLLIPHWGALGAAFATGIALVAYNVLKQIGLRHCTGIRFFDWQYLSFYLLIAGCAAALGLLQLVTRSVWIAVPATIVVSLFLLWKSKHRLMIGETFPELLRVPLLRRLLHVPDGPGT